VNEIYFALSRVVKTQVSIKPKLMTNHIFKLCTTREIGIKSGNTIVDKITIYASSTLQKLYFYVKKMLN
jgi:hypothetical protein